MFYLLVKEELVKVHVWPKVFKVSSHRKPSPQPRPPTIVSEIKKKKEVKDVIDF